MPKKPKETNPIIDRLSEKGFRSVLKQCGYNEAAIEAAVKKQYGGKEIAEEENENIIKLKELLKKIMGDDGVIKEVHEDEEVAKLKKQLDRRKKERTKLKKNVKELQQRVEQLEKENNELSEYYDRFDILDFGKG